VVAELSEDVGLKLGSGKVFRQLEGECDLSRLPRAVQQKDRGVGETKAQ
jgi:hypothetical protein